MNVYLDNAATTRLDPTVLHVMAPFQDRAYGNASSWHRLGVEAARAVEKARHTLAETLHAEPDEIVFTSGGTEANNWAIKGAAWARGGRLGRIVVSAVEHPSVLAPARALKSWGFEVVEVGVDRQGVISPAAVARAAGPGTVLVSVMHANNETGALEPVAELAALCRRRGILFHTDACQSFTKERLDLRGVALASINAHKLHGPKGVGALFVRRGARLAPLLDGGGQERGLRSGTLNVPGIVGFAAAVALARPGQAAKIGRTRDAFWRALREVIPGIRLNGPERGRLCNNLNVLLPKARAKPVLQKLSAAGVFASAGSACAAGKTEPSHVLLAMGLSPEEAARCVRLTLSKDTTLSQARAAARLLARFSAEEAP